MKFTPPSKYRARHKKKPINDKIKVVNPKETPRAMLSCVPRSPKKGKCKNKRFSKNRLVKTDCTKITLKTSVDNFLSTVQQYNVMQHNTMPYDESMNFASEFGLL